MLAAADHPVTIMKQGRAVALMVSIKSMEIIGETMELLADPKVIFAIRKHREGNAKHNDVSIVDEG